MTRVEVRIVNQMVGLILCGLLLASCTGNSVVTDLNTSRSGSVINTDLIAGGGNGIGTDCGDVSISHDGDSLTIDVTSTSGWTMGMVHVYVGTDQPSQGPGVAPGLMPFKQDAGGGTSASFDLPLVGTYPARGNKPASDYDWTGADLVIMFHAEVSTIVDGFQQGQFATYGLYAGSNDTNVGSVSVAVVGTNLEVTVNANQLMSETQLYLGTAIPPFSAGHFTWNSGAINTTSYTFVIPLSEIPGAVCEGDIYMAVHASVGSSSATAWNPGNRLNWGRNPLWKSYTVLSLPSCNESEISETAWAKGDDTTWFPNNGISRWGWWLNYSVN
jgi:hypothetical protein